MTKIELAPGVGDDIERILDHLATYQVAEVGERIRAIIQAIDVLAFNPQIGRPAEGGMRELVIGRGSRGYLALYRYLPEIDTTFVLALKSQSEAGYAKREP